MIQALSSDAPGEPAPIMRNTPVPLLSAVLIVLFSGLTLMFPNAAGTGLNSAKAWTLEKFDWLFALTPIFVLIICVGLAISPYGRIRLGGVDAKPEFRMRSWFAMLFAAGVGIGFMFYGAAEPLAYYTDWFGMPLGAEAGSPEARRLAFSATIFHWGIAPWAIYAIMGLSLGYFAYNQNLPLTIRSIFYPILGRHIWGWPGHLIDLFAVISTVFGLATTIGIGATQASSGLSYLLGITADLTIQIGIIAIISILAVISVIRGVDRGVKWLSNANMVLAAALLVFVIVVGPTRSILAGFIGHFVDYLADTPRLSNWIGRTDTAWFHDWTIFYWAWWVSWSPFVGMFIARISKGRTVREYLSGVIIIPFTISVIWFTAFGETAITQFEVGNGDLSAGISSASITLFQMLQALPLTGVTSLVAMLLLIVFIVTSADSGALVLERMTTHKTTHKMRRWRIFWVAMLALTASTLLYGGGTSALQTLQAGTIVAALPFTFVVFASGVSLIFGMRAAKKTTGIRIEIDASG
jgi:BCCT family betaine/carnitine transporter